MVLTFLAIPIISSATEVQILEVLAYHYNWRSSRTNPGFKQATVKEHLLDIEHLSFILCVGNDQCCPS